MWWYFQELSRFAKYLGIKFAFETEILGFITAIEIAKKFNLSPLWIESNSAYVVTSFTRALSMYHRRLETDGQKLSLMRSHLMFTYLIFTEKRIVL